LRRESCHNTRCLITDPVSPTARPAPLSTRIVFAVSSPVKSTATRLDPVAAIDDAEKLLVAIVKLPLPDSVAAPVAETAALLISCNADPSPIETEALFNRNPSNVTGLTTDETVPMDRPFVTVSSALLDFVNR